jgi:hypothetical protein
VDGIRRVAGCACEGEGRRAPHGVVQVFAAHAYVLRAAVARAVVAIAPRPPSISAEAATPGGRASRMGGNLLTPPAKAVR